MDTMTAITNALERDRAAARLDRLAALQLHAAALLEATIDNPGGDPLLADVGRYVGSVLNEFGFDLAAEQETLRQLIAAWDQSWEQSRSKILMIPEPSPGHARQWLRCRTCRLVQYYDYKPYSFSTPVRWSKCGHGLSERNLGCDNISAADALAGLLADG